MQSDLNPYQSPTAIATEVAPTDIRRPPFGTFLIGIWLLEGGFKAYIVGTGLLRGFNPIPYLADEYHTCNPLVFFLLSSFFIIETIGPWIGIYYLTGRRSRTIPFATALLRTLKVAGGVAIVATLLLMLYCELVGGPT
jgi:hypothetical protein